AHMFTKNTTTLAILEKRLRAPTGALAHNQVVFRYAWVVKQKSRRNLFHITSTSNTNKCRDVCIQIVRDAPTTLFSQFKSRRNEGGPSFDEEVQDDEEKSDSTPCLGRTIADRPAMPQGPS